MVVKPEIIDGQLFFRKHFSIPEKVVNYLGLKLHQFIYRNEERLSFSIDGYWTELYLPIKKVAAMSGMQRDFYFRNYHPDDMKLVRPLIDHYLDSYVRFTNK